MVNTRSMTRNEQNDDQPREQENVQPLHGISSSANNNGSTMMPDNVAISILPPHGTNSERPIPEHETTFCRSDRMAKTSASSLIARRKRLELEVAKRKARIEMDLLDKELEADIADLEDEACMGNTLHENGSSQTVDQWLEQSSQTVEKAQPVHDNGKQTSELCPPAPHYGTPAPHDSAGTVHILATALKDFAAASAATATNGNFVNRLCTPRDLPEFYGDPMEWLSFREAYKESSEVCGFTPKENLWRLRKCLRGAAKEAVSAQLISASSPDSILATLELRFGNPDDIISRVLMDVKKIRHLPNDYQKEIVPFSVKVQNLVEAIRCLKRDDYLQGMNIVSHILSKLPTVLVSKWSDYSFPLFTEGKIPRLVILSDFLKIEAVKISTTSNIYFMEPCFEQNKSNQQRYNSNNRPHAVLLQSANNDAVKCGFCRTPNHTLADCKRFGKALRTVRWQYVKRTGLCFKCLKFRHNRETCEAPVCDIENFGLAHHKLLHYPAANRSTDSNESRQPSKQDAATETVTLLNDSADRKVFLKVVPVRIHGPCGIISTSALLDDGSTVSLVSGALAERAGLRGRRESLHVTGAWTDNQLVLDSTIMNMNISGMDNKVHTIRARSVNELSLPLQCMSHLNCNDYLSLADIQHNLCTTDVKPELLLGQDNYHLLFPLEVRLGKPNEPSATLTPLGWCVHGSVHIPRSVHPSPKVTLFISETGDSHSQDEHLLREIHDEVRRSFTLDSLGVSGKPLQNAVDIRDTEILEESIQLDDGQWFVSSPLRPSTCQMPDSLLNAIKQRNETFLSRYEDRMHHLLGNDFTEVHKDYVTSTSELPYFRVDSLNKKKLRLVFDPGDKVNGYFLNNL